MKAFRSIVALAAIPLSLLAFDVARANLLVNPGAESGSISGWVEGGVSGPRVDNGSFDPGISPHSGSFDFLGGNGLNGSLSQTVSIANTSVPQLAVISFWEQGLNQGAPSDNGYVSLTFLSVTGVPISSVSSPTIDSHNLTWQQYAGSFAVPSGTAAITYTMNFARNVGSDLDTFFDDNELLVVSTVPEISEFAMLSVGLLGVGLVTRRTRGVQRAA